MNLMQSYDSRGGFFPPITRSGTTKEGKRLEHDRRCIASTPDNANRVHATVDAYFAFIEKEGEAFRLLFESDMSVEPSVRERLNRMTYDCAAAASAVISIDTGLPKEASMLLGVGMIGYAQVTARHWLDRDSALTREQAVELVNNLMWRGISGFPRN